MFYDASAGEIHIWIKEFEAYFAASGMQHARTAVQHAYLLNCLDSTLFLQLDRSICCIIFHFFMECFFDW